MYMLSVVAHAERFNIRGILVVAGKAVSIIEKTAPAKT
jgi:hypothetical protein